ncbi:hypothetical protein BDW22DRAFT_669107 [Trametopsis cervina]|nr:hypothetical protein BDW22DRAFT_669107 [Trametopsis cervina]
MPRLTLSSSWLQWSRRMCVQSFNPSQKLFQVIRHEGFPFSGLVEFRWTQDVCTNSTIDHLAFCPNLETLMLVWEESAEWPRLDLLPKLRTVRLALKYAINGEEARKPPHEDSSPPFIYPSITTLAVHHYRVLPSAFITTHLLPRRFPSLQVLTLTGGELGPDELFHFIHCHPTLLEVNIANALSMEVRPEALLKLIDGTGTWKHTGDAQHTGVPICQITPEEYNSLAPYPEDLVWTPPGDGIVVCDDFAFTRTPLSLSATEWQLPTGSPDPRYACSALAMKNLTVDMHSEMSEKCTVTEFLLKLPERVPMLEELRVSTSIESDIGEEFVPWMALIARMASDFKHLKRLAIYPISHNGHVWGYPDGILGAYEPNEDRHVKYLDGVDSPYALRWGESAVTLDSMRKPPPTLPSPEEFEELLVAIRNTLHLENDAKLYEYDDSLLMRAWEARHGRHVTHYIVRNIAEQCPSWERFEWHLLNSSARSGAHRGVRWLWKIERDTRRRPRLQPGELLWTGCAQGDPPMFHMLLGSELERALKDGRSAMTFLTF